ncbi:CDP-alcohol phosphatidyltransferase family protein [Parageobacillus toebii]|uniref:CDP-alcohol phosphatidyltransferase family protein n=1 Tax=Parageobacillus toebii TaxID=153151 RepID=UPI0028157690|nr:CDP-alcohol phosphatidyltransferase family protein [Parageobacillus toebii]WMT19794.1 CDP-alcohol phosphatidyltransferase family protein [Parageobacillus toebii]
MQNLIRKYKSFKSRYVVMQRREHEYIFNKYYAHLIDPFFTKIAYDLKLSPNMVTVLSGFLGVGSGISFMCHQYVLGGILLQLHHFVDGADGNLARLTNRCTAFGAKLDRNVDLIVRITVLLGIMVAANAHLLTNVLLVLTFFLDIVVVHKFVLPFMKKNGIIRSKWKQWFLDRGIIPAFDTFTLYFIISVFAILNQMQILIYVLIVLKNIDWLYRVWECTKTYYIVKNKNKIKQ